MNKILLTTIVILSLSCTNSFATETEDSEISVYAESSVTTGRTHSEIPEIQGYLHVMENRWEVCKMVGRSAAILGTMYCLESMDSEKSVTKMLAPFMAHFLWESADFVWHTGKSFSDITIGDICAISINSLRTQVFSFFGTSIPKFMAPLVPHLPNLLNLLYEKVDVSSLLPLWALSHISIKLNPTSGRYFGAMIGALRNTRLNALTALVDISRLGIHGITDLFTETPEEATELSAKQVHAIIKYSYPGLRTDVLTPDVRYQPLTDEEVCTVLRQAPWRGFNWLEEKFDCDDFAVCFKADISQWIYGRTDVVGKAAAFGILWGFNSKGGHAFNFYITPNYSLRLIEPQSLVGGDDKKIMINTKGLRSYVLYKAIL